MRALLIAAAGGLSLLVGSCATMSEGECLAGDWVGRGYADAAAGASPARLHDHAEACARHGVVPDQGAYHAGWADGIRVYCTPSNGFRVGRQGNSYGGVCPAATERDFLYGYEDGRTVYAAVSAETEARDQVNYLANRLQAQDNEIEARRRELRADGLTREQRDAINARINEIHRDRENTERDWRRSQNALDDAEQRARDVRYRFERTYGSW